MSITYGQIKASGYKNRSAYIAAQKSKSYSSSSRGPRPGPTVKEIRSINPSTIRKVSSSGGGSRGSSIKIINKDTGKVVREIKPIDSGRVTGGTQFGMAPTIKKTGIDKIEGEGLPSSETVVAIKKGGGEQVISSKKPLQEKQTELSKKIGSQKLSQLREEGYTLQEIDLMQRAKTDSSLKERLERGAAWEGSDITTILTQQKINKEYQKLRSANESFEQQYSTLQSNVSQYEEKVARFNEKYAGKQLSKQEYAKAIQEQKALEAEQNRIQSQQASVIARQTELRNLENKTQSTVQEIQSKYEKQRERQEKISAFTQSVVGQSVVSDVGSNKVIDSKMPVSPKLLVTPKQPVGREADIITNVPTSLAIGLRERAGDTTKLKNEIMDFQKLDLKKPATGKMFFRRLGLTKEQRLAESRGILARQLIATAEVGLAVLPVGKIVGLGARLVAETRFGKVLVGSKTGQAVSKLLKPTITFNRYSPIKEERILKEGGQFISGKGKVLYEQKGILAKLLKRKATKKSINVSYEFNVEKLFSVTGKASRKFPRGAPDTLAGIIDTDDLLRLMKAQKGVTASLKGRAGFKGEGIIKINVPGKKAAEYRLVQETSGVFPKQVRVRASPANVFNQGRLITGKFKTRVVGENLSSTKTSFVDFGGGAQRFVQKVKTSVGPKFNVSGLTLKGTGKNLFKESTKSRVKLMGIEKARKLAEKKLVKKPVGKLFKDLAKLNKSNVDDLSSGISKATSNLSKTTSKQASLTSLKTTFTPKVGEVTKQYLDVYGLTVALKAGEKTAKGIATASGVTGLITSPLFKPGEISTTKTGADIPITRASQTTNISTNLMLATMQKQSQDLKQTIKLKQAQVTKQKIVSTTNTKQLRALANDYAISTASATDTMTSQATQTRNAIKFKEAIRTRLKTPTKTRTIARTTTSFNITPTTPITPPPTITIPKLGFGPFSSLKGKGGKRKAFDVLIKKKGKFIKVGSKLPENLAIKLGSSIAKSTSVRTFSLSAAGTTRLKDIGGVSLKQFRTPKGKSSLPKRRTFVEKTRFAINTPGELKEITFAPKKKRKSRKKRKKKR